MPTGTIKWYDNAKGYGFIRQENGPDVFLHFTALSARNLNLPEGIVVDFEAVQDAKGWKALVCFPVEAND